MELAAVVFALKVEILPFWRAFRAIHRPQESEVYIQPKEVELEAAEVDGYDQQF